MKNIKQFDDFTGEDGYLVVDGLTDSVPGGKKSLSDVKNEIISEVPTPPEQVNADWNAESGKAQILNKPTVENGAQVNKIESISIGYTEIEPDENKNVNIDILDGGLDFNNGSLQINAGTGGLYVKNGELDVHCKYPLENYGSTDEHDIRLKYDDTLTLNQNALSVAEPLPSKSNENYRKLLVLNDNKDAIWSDSIPFGSGSEECENNYITPKIPVAVPKDFYYSEDDNHGFPSDYEIEWRDATPPAPNPGFDYSDAPIGTKKSFNLISTVQNINEEFYNTREYDYAWEETQNIPDPKTGSHNGHILTYDSSEGIVWAAPTGLTKAEADTYYAPKSDFDDLVAWLAPISANLVIAASNN